MQATNPSDPSAAIGTLEMPPELIRSVVDNMPTLMAYFDSGLRCRYGNASYRRMFERPGQPLVGVRFESLVMPAMRDLIMPRAHAALRGEPQSFDYERPGPGKQRVHVEVKYTPDCRDGRVHGMLVELHDITSHKRIEDLVLQANQDLEARIQERNAKLFESEQRFRLMVDGLQDYCIYFLDAQGHITDWTESAQRMHGLAAPQVLRQHFGLLMDAAHPGRNPGTRAQMLRQAIDAGHCESDGWQIRNGQPAFWAHTTLTALRDARGTLQGLSAITKDMTALKRLEDVMNDLNQDLEQRVQDRTHELSTANRDIDAFSHMVSHDLRAPLRHLSAYLTLLREDVHEHVPAAACETMLAHLDAMGKSNQKLSSMIEGVLEYARLGRSGVAASPVALGALVSAAVGQAQQAAGPRHIDWHIASGWPDVTGDAPLLTKLLTSLLDNAVKYTRHTPQVCIEVGWRDGIDVDPTPSGFAHPGAHLMFWVRDNGVGFDSAHAHSLFMMFQRQHHSMDFEGSGTGLALSQRIVSLHRGTIRVESQPGQGCMVRVTLPLASPTPQSD